MTTQDNMTYERIAKAIQFLKDNFRQQPSLYEVADKAHLSAYHFQRLFQDWAGVSPKKFLQYISLEHAKSILKEQEASLWEASTLTGLSGTGRLHDLFVNIEGMTPGEYKNGGEKLFIHYSFSNSPFGEILVASTSKGVCHISFLDNKEKGLDSLKNQFPKANISEKTLNLHQQAIQCFTENEDKAEQIKLHLKGSPFQLKVWEALLKIPLGKLTTYGQLAHSIHQPNASRAVGSAIGKNPVAYLIPCHRVIQSSGLIGGYMWGPDRKQAIIGWEAARIDVREKRKEKR